MNNGKKVDGTSHQVLKCILCYVDPINVLNLKIKKEMVFKNIIRRGIITLKKHVNVDHSIIVKKMEEEVEILITKNVERKFVKKGPNVFASAILFYFVVKKPFKKDDVQQKDLLQDLGLLIMKNNLPL